MQNAFDLKKKGEKKIDGVTSCILPHLKNPQLNPVLYLNLKISPQVPTYSALHSCIFLTLILGLTAVEIVFCNNVIKE